MSRRSSTGLAHSLNWYCTAYGLTLSTVRRAKARGWPLDDPEKLYKKLLDSPGATVKLRKLLDLVHGKTAEQSPPESIGDALETGLTHELKRLKAETTTAYKAYKAEKDPLEAAPRLKLYLSLVAQMTNLAKIAPKAELDAANSLPLAEVEACFARSASELRAAIDQVPRRIAMNPIFKKMGNLVEVEEILQTEMNACLRQFESGFLASTPDSSRKRSFMKSQAKGDQ